MPMSGGVDRGSLGSSTYLALADAMHEGALDAAWVHRLRGFVDARLDLADQRLLVLLKLLLAAGQRIPSSLGEDLRVTVIGFKYAMDEPGIDSMCTWTESHQLAFATCEYLAGQLFPDEMFLNDSRPGHVKQARAASRLRQWMADRFHHGFSEWLSSNSYLVDLAALILLADHAEDADLANRAAIIADLICLDLALHCFRGRFVAASARATANQKRDPAQAEITAVIGSLFDDADAPPGGFRPDLVSGIIWSRVRYRVPTVLREIAAAPGVDTVRTSHGLDVAEVPIALAAAASHGQDDYLRWYWGMQAFTLPETIGPTLAGIKRYGLQHNRYFAPLVPFRRLNSTAAALTARSLNPVVSGSALQRGNIQTHRTPHYALSSVQHYRPGGWGDQQNVWQAVLPRDVVVFGTHPASTQVNSEVHPQTPSHWVGNGVNPDVGQFANTLLALYDTRVRHGYLEGHRQELSHLYFPFVSFDETVLTPTLAAGRVEDSYVGVKSLAKLELVSESELVQRGRVTGYAVICADRADYGSLGRFVDDMKQFPFTYEHDTLTLRTRVHVEALRWKGGLRLDGRLVEAQYPRYDCDWVVAPRNPKVIDVRGRSGLLQLNWETGLRRLA